MTWENILLFTITVLPLICTPGPDIMFAISQGISSGRRGALRAIAGLLLGYAAHAVLSALGIATIIAASPILFASLKWLGVAYLSYLAFQMLRSALTVKNQINVKQAPPASLWRGFLTSFLNPKGLLMYLAVLPQFMTPQGNVVTQALILSAVFIIGCGIVYGVVGLIAARASGSKMTDRSRRQLEGFAGTLLVGAAARIASQ
ncbi:MAG: LysE family translocator [Oceanospirillaceae bacterium]|nr:LysE family translocator [Oceanospirillaceae bacterium]